MDSDPLWFFRIFHATNMEYVSIQLRLCLEFTLHKKKKFVPQPMWWQITSSLRANDRKWELQVAKFGWDKALAIQTNSTHVSSPWRNMSI